MIKFASLLGVSLLAVGPAWAQVNSHLTAPADPHLQTRAPRYTNVIAGVKRFDVVEPKDWRELNRAVAPKPGQGGMEGMPGMGGMPGMDKPQGGKGSAGQNGAGMDHSKMPGMNGKSGQGGMGNMPGMGGKRDTGGQ